MTDPIRFESGRPMLFGGLRRQHAFAHADFGGQWRDFSALGPLPGQLGEHAYGVICGMSATECKYICAVDVTALAVRPLTPTQVTTRSSSGSPCCQAMG
ncbi:hypothetical protein RI537_19350 [Aeromonas salmonicida]